MNSRRTAEDNSLISMIQSNQMLRVIKLHGTIWGYVMVLSPFLNTKKRLWKRPGLARHNHTFRQNVKGKKT